MKTKAQMEKSHINRLDYNQTMELMAYIKHIRELKIKDKIQNG